MTDYVEAVIDRRFSGSGDLWALYERTGARLLTAAADLGEFEAGAVYVTAADHSVTVSRSTISEARGVLDDLNLDYDYSFYSMSSVPDRRTRFAVYLWAEQRRIMVTVTTPSQVSSEGLKGVMSKFFEAVHDNSPNAASVTASPQEVVPADSERKRARRPWFKHRYVARAAKWAGGIITGVIAAGFIMLLGWN
ncbi:hypothetical protein [Mycetocola sp. 2940]|uniref:hypothetical protein n=1 Tax=Mycetocola sp. 2940 TaxID=3156452 RepID=UPI00339627B2